MARKKRTLLIIDDEKVFCDTAKEALATERIEVLTANTAAEGLEISSRRNVDVVVLDQKLPDGEGHMLASEILVQNERAKIIFITAYPSIENAVSAVRTGAHDYLSKPFDIAELRHTIERAFRLQELEAVEQVHLYEQELERGTVQLVGAGLENVKSLIAASAASDAPVLITGETGTGKNLVAKAIHYAWPHQSAVFCAINCASLPENLIEAELFGYERGAFTGAIREKRGLIETADGGTLFLDEIGEMQPHLQSKLLSVIEDRAVRRVGGNRMKRISVRFIAATNRAIEEALGTTFRKDLYYRMSVMRIDIPPLRSRRNDIPELCEHFLKQFASRRAVRLEEEELERLMGYEWPGNVRELRNVLERAVLTSPPDVRLRPSAFIEIIGAAAPPSGEAAAHAPDAGTLADMERSLILSTLERRSGNLAQTSRALGISLSTLKRKIRSYGLR